MKRQQTRRSRKSYKQSGGCCEQDGGGSSDYVQSFHAYGVDPAQLSRYTLSNIDNAPMFHPLETNVMFPTGTSGVVPTGAYYDSIAPIHTQNTLGPATPGLIQMGGGRKCARSGARSCARSRACARSTAHASMRGGGGYTNKQGKLITNPWIIHVYQFAEKHNMSYSEAMKDPRTKETYKSGR
jgi:hypothetical protein